jgi:hypothetical protein
MSLKVPRVPAAGKPPGGGSPPEPDAKSADGIEISIVMSGCDPVMAVSAGGTDVGRPLGSFTEQVIAARA